MQIVIVNGSPRCGKDTFCNFVQKMLGEHRCAIFSTVDKMKEIAYSMGWNGIKTPEVRKFLSDLKDISTQWCDYPFQNIKRRIENFGYGGRDGIVFIMSREPEEIKRFEDELGAISILIRRDAVEDNAQSNHADANVLNHNYTEVIYNNGSFADLQKQAEDFIERRGIYNYNRIQYKRPRR